MTRNPNYDLWIERDSDTFGLMLEHKKNSKGETYPIYNDGRSAVMLPSVGGEQASYASFPSWQDFPIPQTTWHAGFGRQVHNSKYPNDYGESVGWDASIPNVLRLSPQERAATVTLKAALATASFSNMDFESAYGADWTKKAVTGLNAFTAERSTASKKAGTYSWKLEAYKADDFSADNSWTEVGAGIVVDHATNHRLDFVSDDAAVDDRCCLDLTSMPDTVWRTTFDFHVTSADNWGTVYIGCFSAATNVTGFAGDAIWARFTRNAVGGVYEAYLASINGGAADATSTAITGFSENTTYYVELKRTSATEAVLSICSDAGMVTHLTGSPKTITVDAGVATLRYFQVSNATAVGATAYTGWIDNWTHRGCPVDTDNRITQALTGWASWHNNKPITFSVYGKTTLATNLRVGLSFDGGSNVTWQTGHCGTTNDWTDLMTVTTTPLDTATGIMLVIQRISATYSDADYVDVAAFTQTASSRGTPLGFINWGSDWYYLENKTLFKVATTTFTEVYNLAAAITDAVVFTGRLVLANGYANNWYYTSDGTTFTKASEGSAVAQYFAVFGGTLWHNRSAYQVSSTLDVTGASTTRNDIGDSGTSITDMFCDGTLIFIGKTDGVYYQTVSGGTYTAVPINPEFTGSINANNFKNTMVSRGAFLPFVNGLHFHQYTTYSTIEDISPIRYAPYYTDYHGRPAAMAAATDWLYAILNPTGSNTKAKVMRFRLKDIPDAEVETDWRWHTYAQSTIDTVTGAGIFNNTLWVCGTDNSVQVVSYWKLDGTDYPSDGNGVKVEFQIDGGSWTELNGTGTGTFTTAGLKGFQKDQHGKRTRYKISAVAGTCTFITSYYDGNFPMEDKCFLTFELQGTTFTANSATTTPEITGYLTRCSLSTVPQNTITCTVKCQDNILTKRGHDNIQARTIKAYLNSCASEADYFTLYDPRGDSLLVKLLPPSPHEYDIEIPADIDSSNVKSKIELIFQKLKTS